MTFRTKKKTFIRKKVKMLNRLMDSRFQTRLIRGGEKTCGPTVGALSE